MSALILSGDVYIKQADDVGFYKICPADKFTVSVASPDKKEIRSKCRANYNALAAAYSFPGKHSVKIESQAFDKRAFAMAFLGTSASETVASSTVSNESVTLAKDIWVPVGDGQPCSAISVDSLVADTDYQVDLEAGMIKALTTSGEGTHTADYTVIAKTGYTINAQTVSGIVSQVMLIGRNLLTGERVKFLAKQVSLSPSGDIDFLAQDMNSFTLEGDIVLPQGEQVPYTIQVLG